MIVANPKLVVPTVAPAGLPACAAQFPSGVFVPETVAAAPPHLVWSGPALGF